MLSPSKTVMLIAGFSKVSNELAPLVAVINPASLSADPIVNPASIADWIANLNA
jgi:hypothetical protein